MESVEVGRCVEWDEWLRRVRAQAWWRAREEWRGVSVEESGK